MKTDNDMNTIFTRTCTILTSRHHQQAIGNTLLMFFTSGRYAKCLILSLAFFLANCNLNAQSSKKCDVWINEKLLKALNSGASIDDLVKLSLPFNGISEPRGPIMGIMPSGDDTHSNTVKSATLNGKKVWEIEAAFPWFRPEFLKKIQVKNGRDLRAFMSFEETILVTYITLKGRILDTSRYVNQYNGKCFENLYEDVWRIQEMISQAKKDKN